MELVSLQDKRILLFTVSRIYTSMPVPELKSPTKRKQRTQFSRYGGKRTAILCTRNKGVESLAARKGEVAEQTMALHFSYIFCTSAKGSNTNVLSRRTQQKWCGTGLDSTHPTYHWLISVELFQELNGATIWEGALLFQEQQVHNQQAAHSHLFMQKSKSVADLLELTGHYQRNTFMCVKLQCSCLT